MALVIRNLRKSDSKLIPSAPGRPGNFSLHQNASLPGQSLQSPTSLPARWKPSRWPPQLSSQTCLWAARMGCVAVGVVSPISVYCLSKSLSKARYKGRKEIRFFLSGENVKVTVQKNLWDRRCYCRSLENAVLPRGVLIDLSLFSLWYCLNFVRVDRQGCPKTLDQPCWVLTHSFLLTGQFLMGPVRATLCHSHQECLVLDFPELLVYFHCFSDLHIKPPVFNPSPHSWLKIVILKWWQFKEMNEKWH